MTKPEERAHILNSLLILWEQMPQLRFCQLVANINRHTDGYYIEDDAFLERLEQYEKEHAK